MAQPSGSLTLNPKTLHNTPRRNPYDKLGTFALKYWAYDNPCGLDFGVEDLIVEVPGYFEKHTYMEL